MNILVASAADARYALPLAVMLRSVASHLAPDAILDAYVLDDGLHPADRAKVCGSLTPNVRLHWISPPAPVAGLPMWGRMSNTTYRKLTLGEWLPPELDRVLWLDCDLLVTDDISRLWAIDLGGRTLLAVRDERVPLISSRFGVAAWRELGLSPSEGYFNAGVLLVDLALWRNRQVYRRSIEYLHAYSNRVYFFDQEALNAVLVGQWGELDQRWNHNPMLDRLAGARRAAQPAGVPWIIHFSGNLKPWNSTRGGPYLDLYRRCLDQTAWSGWRARPSLRQSIIDQYESSRLRPLLYPAEKWWTVAVRAVTRTSSRPKET